MRRSELESLAARWVPGEGTLDIHRLKGGLVNETYRVLRDGVAYALRLAVANPYDLGLDREWEARILECAVRAGLAPPMEYCDPQRGILISRWIDGRSWTQVDVRRRSNIARMADLARRIHALPMPMPARVMSPSDWIEDYRAALARTGADSKRRLVGPPCVRDDTALQDAAAGRLAKLAELPGLGPVVSHSDLHALNLIDRDSTQGLVSDYSLVLLDWEYAHASDPLWDLAGWSANNDLEDEMRRELLTGYAGRSPTSDEWSRLGLLCWLFDYVCLLWCELYLKLQGDVSRGNPMVDGVSARAQLLEARLHASPRVVEPIKFRHTTGPKRRTPRGEYSTEASMARMIVVDRDGKEHEIEAKPGLKVMEILRELDYGVAAICGGLCSCATCHVFVDESWAARLPKPQSDELELLKELPDFKEATSRLSCQVDFTEALSGLKLAIAPDS